MCCPENLSLSFRVYNSWNVLSVSLSRVILWVEKVSTIHFVGIFQQAIILVTMLETMLSRFNLSSANFVQFLYDLTHWVKNTMIAFPLTTQLPIWMQIMLTVKCTIKKSNKRTPRDCLVLSPGAEQQATQRYYRRFVAGPAEISARLHYDKSAENVGS